MERGDHGLLGRGCFFHIYPPFNTNGKEFLMNTLLATPVFYAGLKPLEFKSEKAAKDFFNVPMSQIKKALLVGSSLHGYFLDYSLFDENGDLDALSKEETNRLSEKKKNLKDTKLIAKLKELEQKERILRSL